MLNDFYNVLLESVTDMKMVKSIDDLTNDIILTFYIGKDEIGTAQLEYIKINIDLSVNYQIQYWIWMNLYFTENN